MLAGIIQHLADSVINPVPYSYRILIFEGEEVFVEKVGSSRNENLIDYLSLATERLSEGLRSVVCPDLFNKTKSSSISCLLASNRSV